MKLTYEKYLELIPESTKKFVEATLPYLWIYVKRGKKIKLKNTESCYTDGKMPLTISALLGASTDPEVKSFFESKDFNPSRINISPEELPKLTLEDKKEIFEQSQELFTPYVDKTKYSTIQPIDIINHALTLDDRSYQFNEMLKYIGVNQTLKESVSSSVKRTRLEQELALERELFDRLPISTINFLETASRIRTLIINQFQNNGLKDQELLKNDETYIVPISLLLALYEYEGQEKTEIVNYFKSKGITLDAIRRNLTGLTTQDIKYTSRNLEAINQLYKRYWTTGANEGKNEEEIQVVDILNNVLDRNFTGVITIDKLFEKLGTSTDEFDNLKQNIESELNRRKIEDEINYAKNFYKDLRRDTKDFVNLTTKTYQLLLKKMQEGKHNTDILNCEDDADTLALYIASHFYNTDFEKFYVAHGVTFDKVMQLLGLKITREEIEQEELNQKIAVDRFKRFVTSGVNTNKRAENISVNDVAYNLCNRDFNKSMIMENIFEEIRRDIDLPANFMSTVEKFFKEQEESRKRRLTEEYFSDKSNEVYDFLERTCRAYATIKAQIKNDRFQEDELIPIALLYATLETETEIKALYEYMGISKQTLDSHLNINFNRYMQGSFDIDLILNKIAPYIEKVQPKEQKEPLKVETIAENIFTSKRPKSLQLSRLLSKFALSYESFDDLSLPRNKMAEAKAEEATEEEAKKFLVGCSNNAIETIKDATKIYQVLIETTNEDMAKLTPTDIEDISILLSILNRTDLESYHYFRKYNVNEQAIINLLNLPKDLRSKADDKKYSAKSFLSHFKEYGNNNARNNLTPNDILNKLLEKNSSKIKASLEALGVEYDIFTRECYTRKDYESTLSIDDRCKMLDRTITPDINPSTTTSIITYGNDLTGHTSFINEHCTELVLRDQNQEATETIQGVLAKVYEKTSVPTREQTWLEKLLGTEVETKEEVKINGYAISDLKAVVSRYITPLYDDIKTFDSLVKYLEIYRKKVLEHRDKAEQMLEQLTEEEQTIDEDDIERKLRVGTYKRAVSAKKESFELTDHLIKQYIYKTYLVIQNNLVTITGLEMSRDVLIPLLEAEVMLGNSLQNQSEGATVTEHVIKLLEDVVKRNVAGIEQSLSAVKKSGIPEDTLSVLSQDVAKYLLQIGETQDPNTIEIKSIPQPTSETPMQKVYTFPTNQDGKK